tara:strand:+ start:3318 stop:3980 length:663 start_codon:yes stop_codon:yes gene_type:complete
MIIKTRGIVLGYVKYGETSIICKIYTEENSIQSFIINGIRKSKSKNTALYQPLTILDLVIYYKENSGIQRIKEAKFDTIYNSLHTDIKKISVCYYMSEFLSKILKSSEIHESQFNFIVNSLIAFDNIENQFSNFHIQFFIKLTKFYGIDILSSTQLSPSGSEDELLRFIDHCINKNYEVKYNSNNILRNKVLNLLTEYYSRHMDINIKLNSTEVLKEIFN